MAKCFFSSGASYFSSFASEFRSIRCTHLDVDRHCFHWSVCCIDRGRCDIVEPTETCIPFAIDLSEP